MTPRKFRKLPVVIEAMQYLNADDKDTTDDCLMFCFDAYSIGDALLIQTLEGDMRCPSGSWIIKGVEGEFYAVEEKIFAKTYKEVT